MTPQKKHPKKQEMLEQIRTWVDYVRAITRFDKNRVTLKSPEGNPPVAVVKEAYDWLHKVINSTYKDARYVYTRTDAHLWELMFDRGEKEMKEMLLFKAALRVLREDMKSKPVFFKRTNWEEPEDVETESANAGKKSRKTRKADRDLEQNLD